MEVAGQRIYQLLSFDSRRNHKKSMKTSLNLYPGGVIEDGVGAICDTINQSENPVTIIAIGPLPNIKCALQRAPIIENSKFIGMGSLRIYCLGAPKPMKEYNVKQHVVLRSVFEAGWEKDNAADTCGNIILTGDNFMVRNSADDLVRSQRTT